MNSILRAAVVASSCVVSFVLAGCTTCGSYSFSSCPVDRCERRCVASGCGHDVSGETICTADCDGAGSCVSPGGETHHELEGARQAPRAISSR